MTDVAVLGAGVVGAATAHALVEAGARVEVLEAGAVAGGTSAATFAIDISRTKTPHSLFELSLASAREHVALEQASGTTWRHPAGCLEWDGSNEGRERIRARARRLRAWEHPVEWVSGARARELEPALVVPGNVRDDIALYRAGAWYEPRVLARTLLDRSCARGAGLRARDPVTSIRTARGRITEVRTAAGHRVRPGAVALCAGPQASELAALAGAELRLWRVPGLVVETTSAPTGLRTIIAADDLNLRPDRADRAMLHSWLVDDQLGRDPVQARVTALAHRLLDRARALVPGLQAADVRAARLGLRPIPLDGLPLVGFLPAVENLYAIAAHSAVHLAPILGRLAAAELSGVPPDARLELLRPTRPGARDEASEALDESTRTMLSRITPTAVREPADAS